MPIARTPEISEGGFTKFGGAPLGFAPRGILERSVPGGKLRDILRNCNTPRTQNGDFATFKPPEGWETLAAIHRLPKNRINIYRNLRPRRWGLFASPGGEGNNVRRSANAKSSTTAALRPSIATIPLPATPVPTPHPIHQLGPFAQCVQKFVGLQVTTQLRDSADVCGISAQPENYPTSPLCGIPSSDSHWTR